jgi:hypothetical protein
MTNNKPTYSILLMRDDHAVSTFRVRTLWFKGLLALFLLLLAVCGLGSYGAVYYKGKYDAELRKNDQLQMELSETKVRLQDRTNLSILPDGVPGQDSSAYIADNVRPVTPGAEAGTATSSIETITAGRAAGQGAFAPDVPGLQHLGPEETTSSAAPTAAPNSEDMESHAIRVSNVSLSYEAGNRAQVIFDIANQPQKETLSGGCAIFAVTRQGGLVELETVVRNSLSFRIRMFRKMSAALKVPEGLARDDIVSLRFVVKVPGLPDYVKVVPLNN